MCLIFFILRNRQVHDEVAHARNANFKAMFPTWDDRIDILSPEQIDSLLTKLDMSPRSITIDLNRDRII